MMNLYLNEFRADKSVLICLVCEIQITASQKSQVDQHRVTGKHASGIARKSKTSDNKTQTLLSTLNNSAENDRNSIEFHMDLMKAFAEANIPLHKMTYPAVRTP